MTAITFGTAREASVYCVENTDMVRDLQSAEQDLKIGVIETANTADASDTITINLYERFGIKRLLGVKGWRHTTDYSVIESENPTTAVINDELTITVLAAGTSNDKRVYVIMGV